MAADFVMVPKPKSEKKTFFKGGVFVTPNIIGSSPSKTKKKKLGFFGGKNKGAEKSKEKSEDAPVPFKATIIWFGLSFGYESSRRSQVSLLVYKLLLGPMVRHYALLYGFHTLPNMLIKPLGEEHGFVTHLCT